MKIIRPHALLRSYYNGLTWQLWREKKTIALTFDDGPCAETTENILATLDNYKIQATFFCTGNNAQSHPKLMKKIEEQGHSIGNHTYDHLNGWKTNTETYLKNVDRAASITSSRLFRPPYGKITKKQIKALHQKDYQIIMWTLLSYDFKKNITVPKILAKLKGKTVNGSIATFHDSLKAEPNAQRMLPEMIEFWMERNYHFTAL